MKTRNRQIEGAEPRQLRFENGIWWYRNSHHGAVSEITSVMREANYDAEALAHRLCVGNRSFHRIVKESLGISPGIWLRMERAVAIRHQLREGHSIKQLAAEYGFRYSGDFSDEFKRWHGVNPSEFVADHRAFRDS